MGDAMMATKISVLEDWCERVWGQQDARAIDEIFEDDGSAKGLSREELTGPAEFRLFHSAICALLSDTSMTVEDYIEQDNKLANICTFRGTCRKTGKKVLMEGSMFAAYRGDKLLSCDNHFEFMALFEQLELLPKNSFATALSGEQVV